MKLLDFVIALAIGILVGLPVYLVVNNYLLTKDRFKAEIEVVNTISGDFNTTDSANIFTEDKVDYSSPVQLNTERNSRPFVNDN